MRMGIHRTEGCQVTDEMIEAIRVYRTANGKIWKSKLAAAWTRGEDLGDLLQQVRNIVGPTRLYKMATWITRPRNKAGYIT